MKQNAGNGIGVDRYNATIRVLHSVNIPLYVRRPQAATAAPSFHKYGSSMASDGSSNSSSIPDRQQIARQRLRIIAGHLQKPLDPSDEGISARECSAPDNQPGDTTTKSVPRRRWAATHRSHRWMGGGSFLPWGCWVELVLQDPRYKRTIPTEMRCVLDLLRCWLLWQYCSGAVWAWEPAARGIMARCTSGCGWIP